MVSKFISLVDNCVRLFNKQLNFFNKKFINILDIFLNVTNLYKLKKFYMILVVFNRLKFLFLFLLFLLIFIFFDFFHIYIFLRFSLFLLLYLGYSYLFINFNKVEFDIIKKKFFKNHKYLNIIGLVIYKLPGSSKVSELDNVTFDKVVLEEKKD